MQCIALDIGSSTIKGAVLDFATGEISHITSRSFPARQAGLPAQRYEVDPYEIERAVRAVIESLMALAPDANRLYVAGQMGGLLLLDQHGEPLTNYLSWQDQRTQASGSERHAYLTQLRDRLGDDLFQQLGRELQPGSTLALLCWLGDHGALPRQATPVTVADYFISRLCKTSGHMHLTQAIGLLDLRSLDWHREVFERLGLGEIAWPGLIRKIEPIGKCSVGNRKLEVYGAYGDQQCALYGVGLERGELSINISTGSQVSLRTNSLEPGEFQTRPYFDDDLLQTISHLPAGRSLNALVRLLTEIPRASGAQIQDVWNAIVRLTDEVDQVSGDDSLVELGVDLTFFAANQGMKGSITGITTENLTVGRLFHAAFRSMVSNYFACAARLDPAQTFRQVVLSGSLPRSVPTLRRMIERQFHAPIRHSVNDEETLLGLLKIARED